MESMVKDAKVVETGGSESDQVAERLGKLPLDAAGGNDEDQKATSDASEAVEIEGIRFVDYKDESQLQYVMSLVGKDLSEPYSSKCVVGRRMVLQLRRRARIGAAVSDTTNSFACALMSQSSRIDTFYTGFLTFAFLQYPAKEKTKTRSQLDASLLKLTKR